MLNKYFWPGVLVLAVFVILALVGCTPGKSRAATKDVDVDFTPTVEKQINKWLTELVEQQADPVAYKLHFENDPIALNQALGEIEFWTWLLLNKGTSVNTPPSQRAIDAALYVAKSYDGAGNYLETMSDGSHVSRKEMSDSLNGAIGKFGLEIPAVVFRDLELEIETVPCNPAIEECTQWAYGHSNYFTTNYVQGAGDSDSDWFDELDEGIVQSAPDDASTYWASPSNPSNECIAVDMSGLGILPPSPSSLFQYFRWRHYKTSGSTVDVTIKLYEDGVFANGQPWYDFPRNREVWENTSATAYFGDDWDAIQVEYCTNKPGGGGAVVVWVTGFEAAIADPDTQMSVTETE